MKKHNAASLDRAIRLSLDMVNLAPVSLHGDSDLRAVRYVLE